MDAAGREMQVRTFVEDAWNGRNYQAVSDLYADTYADGCLRTPWPGGFAAGGAPCPAQRAPGPRGSR